MKHVPKRRSPHFCGIMSKRMACPNANFRVEVYNTKDLVAALNKIGPRLNAIFVNAGGSNVDTVLLKNAWDNWGTLRELSMYRWSGRDLELAGKMFLASSNADNAKSVKLRTVLFLYKTANDMPGDSDPVEDIVIPSHFQNEGI